MTSALTATYAGKPHPLISRAATTAAAPMCFGFACIAGIPDLSVVPDLPYSISIHDIGLGGIMIGVGTKQSFAPTGQASLSH